jgi:hypothetical protein
VVAHLEGQDTPNVEFFGLSETVDRLVARWRVYHDYGSTMGDPRAIIKSAGE